MKKISKESIEQNLSDWEDIIEPILRDELSEHNMGWMMQYRSPCKRYTLITTKVTNMFDPETGIGWNLHIDNSDMCTIASCNVEYIGQVKQLIEIYKDY